MSDLITFFILSLTIFPTLIIPIYLVIIELIQKNYKILYFPITLFLIIFFICQINIGVFVLILLLSYIVVFIPFTMGYLIWLFNELFQMRYKSFFFGVLPVFIPMVSIFLFNFFCGDLILITQAQQNMKIKFDSPAFECCEKLINEYPNSPYLEEAIEMRKIIFKRNPGLQYLKKQKN